MPHKNVVLKIFAKFTEKYLCQNLFFNKVLVKMLAFIMFLLGSEAVVHRCFVKKLFLDILQNSHENTCVTVSFFKIVAGWGLQLY